MAIKHTWTVIGKKYTGKITMGRPIRQHCIDCSGGYRYEVNRCHITTCALHPFRSGKDPSKKLTLTERQKTAAMINLKKAHESKIQK